MVCSRGVPGGDPPMATSAGGMHPTGMHSRFCTEISIEVSYTIKLLPVGLDLTKLDKHWFTILMLIQMC